MTRLFSTFAFLATLVAFYSGSAAIHAAEPNCAMCDASLEMLSKIPYLNRLFKNVAVCESGEAAQEELPAGVCIHETPVCVRPFYSRHVGPDGLERVGVDFDFEIDGPCATGHYSAQQCAAAECTSGQCAVGRCPINDAPAMAVFAPPVPFAVHHPLMAQLQVVTEQNRQLLEALVESRVEIATLAAKMEFAAEREKLVVENAVLKAQSAAPVAVAAVDSETNLLREENAALKAKLAALEERLATLEQPVKKTADKGSSKRKR